ncbi:MAG: hypothetical protein GX595_13405, partial [Lentisphaerae bacterium]|nr:hypothetical protein [Lentisphaerota bacterium]
MTRHRRALVVGFALLVVALPAALEGAVSVRLEPRQVSPIPEGQRVIQTVTLANEITSYALTYDIQEKPGQTDEITSHWWIWTLDFVTLGMTEPSGANWYFQGFLNWTFDDEALHRRPAVIRVVRDGGADGVVEVLWDTPKVTAVLRLALASNSDKLLVFGSYEPKVAVKDSRLKLICYPTGYAQPRQRAVTTALGTARPGETLVLDPARQRWVLYEDTTPGRPGCGPAGLIVGTPEAFDEVRIPVGEYGIETHLRLKPDQRRFALGLYDFPTLPDLEATRSYFRASADAEARWLAAAAAAADPGQVLPVGVMPRERRQAVVDFSQRLLKRDIERWRPDPAPLAFPWARALPGGPIQTVLFCPRYRAYETMELARRLDLQVRHLYWDSSAAISQTASWPYAQQTGQGPLGSGVGATLAADLCSADGTELFLCAEIEADSLPGPVQNGLLERVRQGAGLVLSGRPGTVNGWPRECFAEPDAARTAAILEAFPWGDLPGFDPGTVPVQAYRLGQGVVVALRLALPSYGALVPHSDAIEGRAGAVDRALALAARAALAASGRLGPTRVSADAVSPDGRRLALHLEPPPEAGTTLLVRITDDLDQEHLLTALPAPGPTVSVDLPALPAGRRCWLDVVRRDAAGRALDLRTLALPSTAPWITGVDLEPVVRRHPAATPQVPLPTGGALAVRVSLEAAGLQAGVELVGEVRDAFDRLLARAAAPAAATVRLDLALPRPVTVCHRLDLHLQRGTAVLASARQRFTLPMDYPFEDFTALMWSYASAAPVLQRTDRLCYDLGADMVDLCHMGGYDDARASREYELSARSGLRLVPYVTRLAGEVDASNHRRPCLHDPAYLGKTSSQLAVQARQAGPYSPAAFTLGDENYLQRGQGESCATPATLAAFRDWLARRYATIEALNTEWGSAHGAFADITTPMTSATAATQTASLAPWLDHRLFMDEAFAQTHEAFAKVIQEELPDAKVGWDGLLGYHWLAGYDFTQLCSPVLQLNQTYTTQWLQGELVRSFKAPGALTGKWGNADADNADGFAAWPWTCLLTGDNSVWWWTSWGCDYIPFNPDLSLSAFGEWFFAAVREVTAGPGRLLLQARRLDSGIGVLYSQPDMLVTTLLDQMGAPKEIAGAGCWQREHTAALKLLHDLGYEYRHLSWRELEAGRLPGDGLRLVVLTGAVCVSDRQAAALRAFVEAGGVLLCDGRAGLLSGAGRLREARALDDLLGVTSPAGRDGLTEPLSTATLGGEAAVDGLAKAITVSPPATPVRLLSPGLRPAGAAALWSAGETPVGAVRRLGRGSAITTNIPWSTLAGDRLAD